MKYYYISNKAGDACLNVDTGQWCCPSNGNPTLFNAHGRLEYENERHLPNGAFWLESTEHSE